MNKLIKLLGYEDYFFTIGKNNEYNTTSKTELHALNDETYRVVGALNCITYLIKYRIKNSY